MQTCEHLLFLNEEADYRKEVISLSNWSIWRGAGSNTGSILSFSRSIVVVPPWHPMYAARCLVSCFMVQPDIHIVFLITDVDGSDFINFWNKPSLNKKPTAICSRSSGVHWKVNQILPFTVKETGDSIAILVVINSIPLDVYWFKVKGVYGYSSL